MRGNPSNIPNKVRRGTGREERKKADANRRREYDGERSQGHEDGEAVLVEPPWWWSSR